MISCRCPSCNGDGPDYPDECPDTCASMTVTYEKCGGVGECICFLHRFLGLAACAEETTADCDCPSPEEIAEDRAEARADARADDR